MMADTLNIRKNNLMLILEAMKSSGEMTAAMIAEKTGLSAATISRSLLLLKTRGLIISCGKDNSEQLGRRPDVFSLHPDYAFFIYCHLSGDCMSAYLIDFYGSTRRSVTTEAAVTLTPEAFSQKLLALKSQLLSGAYTNVPCLNLVVSLPGIISRADGTVSRIPNYPSLEHCRIAELASAASDLPCQVYNGTRLSALGEYLKSGAERGSLVQINITGKYGIGAGIVLGGELYEDREGIAGEIGDMVLIPDQVGAQSVLSKGALEEQAGLELLLEKAQYLLSRGAAPQLQQLMLQQKTKTVTLRLLQQAAQTLDFGVLNILNHTVQLWAAAIINTATLLAPDVIVVGGAISEEDTLICSMLQQHVRAHYYRDLTLRFAKRDSDAHILGAINLSQKYLLDAALARVLDGM